MDSATRQALGLIEAWGHVSLITALDAAIKAAQVTLTSSHLVGGGLSTATVRGDVGAVRAAVSAAQATFSRIGAQGMTSVHVIARPDASIWAMLKKDGLKVDDQPPSPSGGNGGPGGRGPKADPPAVKAEAKAPAVKAAPQAPAVKPEASVPAVKAKAEAPAHRAEAKPPAVKADPIPKGGAEVPAPKAEAKPPAAKAGPPKVIKNYDEYPAVKPKKSGPAKPERKAKKARKSK